MMSNAFEAAFDAFLERREYDEAQQAQFALVRAAFLAGWLAAGGDRPQQARHAHEGPVHPRGRTGIKKNRGCRALR